MKQRYNEVMEHIVVTDEMRARILAAVQQADLTPRKKAIRFDRILKMAAAAAACAAVVVVGQNAMPKMGSAAPADTGAYTDRAEKASDSCEMAMQAVNGIQECPENSPCYILRNRLGSKIGCDVADIRLYNCGSTQLRIFKPCA